MADGAEPSGEGGAGGAECRICMMADSLDNLVEPCGCRGGMQHAHHTCVQKWILTDQEGGGILGSGGAKDHACEICGEPWKGDFKLPSPTVARTPEEEMELVKTQILSSWLRHCTNQSRPHDEILLLRVATLVPGPWTDYVHDLASKIESKEKWDRRKAKVKSFFGRGGSD